MLEAAPRLVGHLETPAVRHLRLVLAVFGLVLLSLVTTRSGVGADEARLFQDQYPVPDCGVPSLNPPAALCLPKLAGRILDYTRNSGIDRRVWSPSLGCWRDLYIYLPPCFDSSKRYPVAVYLHGVLQDEKSFVTLVAPELDAAILTGKLPPMIVAAPDGSFDGEPSRYAPGSFYINGPRGNFQDWIVLDLWSFLAEKFPIRPENKAHVLVGVSMGGFGAFNIAIKRHEQFGVALGVLPALNVRWMGCDGCYFSDFTPENWCWRTRLDRPNEIIGRFGFIQVSVRQFIYPAFGAGATALALAALENPIELLERYPLKDGDLDMWVGYAEEDEFNLDAQAESFIYQAQSQGLSVTSLCIKRGRHSEATATAMLPHLITWLRSTLERHQVAAPLSR